MTAEHESDRVPSPAQYPQPPSMPRLFADADDADFPEDVQSSAAAPPEDADEATAADLEAAANAYLANLEHGRDRAPDRRTRGTRRAEVSSLLDGDLGVRGASPMWMADANVWAGDMAQEIAEIAGDIWDTTLDIFTGPSSVWGLLMQGR